jgi:GDP-L-fucose synthase
MPSNLYGPGDNYDLETSHVIPALIRKFHEAKIRSDKEVVAWGTGAPRREFLYSDDLAASCVFLMQLPDQQFDELLTPITEPPLINIGYAKDLTVGELVKAVKDVVGFQGEVVWDTSKPDGTMVKLLDSSRVFHLGWRPKISLPDGLRLAYEDFLSRQTC